MLQCSLQNGDTSGVRIVQLLLALLPPDMAPWRLCPSPATQDEDAFKVQITRLTVIHSDEMKLSSYTPPCLHNICIKIPKLRKSQSRKNRILVFLLVLLLKWQLTTLSEQVYCSLRAKSCPQLGWHCEFCSFKRFTCSVYTCTGFEYKPFIFRLTLSANKGSVSNVQCC